MSLKTHNGQESLLSSSTPPLNAPHHPSNHNSNELAFRCGLLLSVECDISPVALFTGLNLWFCRSERDDDMLENGSDVDRR